MKASKNKQSRVLVSTMVLLTVGWLAVPQAGQDGANDGFILFTSDRDNPNEDGICERCEDIYVMARDGTNPGRLTKGGGADEDLAAYNSGGPDWSHSRQLIAFHSDRVNEEPQIHLMNPDGTDQRLLVSLPGGAAFPSFSHSGNELCFHGQASPRDIYIVNVDGTGLTNLTKPYREPGPNGEPPMLTGDSIRCDWSPKRIAIAFTNDGNGNQEIYVIDADGTDLRRLTDVGGRDANPAFSPKGDLIAFESNRDGRSEIYVMSSEGTGTATRLTNFSGGPTPLRPVVTKPTWSPLGDRIAFHRRVGPEKGPGHFQVYTMDADGANPLQITFTPAPGFSGFPTWAKGFAPIVPE